MIHSWTTEVLIAYIIISCLILSYLLPLLSVLSGQTDVIGLSNLLHLILTYKCIPVYVLHLQQPQSCDICLLPHGPNFHFSQIFHQKNCLCWNLIQKNGEIQCKNKITCKAEQLKSLININLFSKYLGQQMFNDCIILWFSQIASWEHYTDKPTSLPWIWIL